MKEVEDSELSSVTPWTDDSAFNLTAAVDRHNCVYWSSTDPNIHVDKAVTGLMPHPEVLWDRF
jgi:hypothetical protein